MIETMATTMSNAVSPAPPPPSPPPPVIFAAGVLPSPSGVAGVGDVGDDGDGLAVGGVGGVGPPSMVFEQQMPATLKHVAESLASDVVLQKPCVAAHTPREPWQLAAQQAHHRGEPTLPKPPTERAHSLLQKDAGRVKGQP